MTNKFYFDTYALVEIYKENPNYIKYKQNITMILNKLNILEYIYFLLKENRSDEDIKQALAQLGSYNVDYDDEIFIKAAKMKKEYSKEKLSFVDCIGYFLAKKYNAKFLTGDKGFRHRDNVVFVK